MTDADINRQRIDEQRANSDSPLYYRKRDRWDMNHWLLLLVPHIIGLIVGFALTKLIGLEGSSFFVIGGICAFIAGTYKSVALDKISFVPAIVRNIILMFLLIGAIALIYLIGITQQDEY